MAQFSNYFPHNNMENVVKIMRNNTILKICNENVCVAGGELLKKSFRSNLANTSFSSKKTSQKSKAIQSVKSEEEEVEKEKNEDGTNKT